MKIGPYTLANPIALAPMAGVTDRPFRQLCRELGAGYVVSEMVTSNPQLRHTRKSTWRSNFEGEPGPIAVQIVGGDPASLAEAAAYNVGLGAQIIDINMGCPAKKVCGKLGGSALLSDIGLVEDILATVTQSIEVPVTLKIRTGPNPGTRNGVEVAAIAEACGIAALAVHGRTRADRFKGDAEYETIRDICRAVSIPVFANGDVETPEKARQVLEFTGAQGLMIGRGAQGNPWVFRELSHYLDTGRILPPPQDDEIHAVMCEHLQRLHDFYGRVHGVRVARKHIGWYLKGRPGTRQVLYDLMRVESPYEQFQLLEQYFLSPTGAMLTEKRHNPVRGAEQK
ncbi:MAG: tRNA dihydrouridine synthase DusB [Xanthomonadales bacterium]|nr:tRNA dihydrouridine synthase DusB [Xanthomonadales bacterium]